MTILASWSSLVVDERCLSTRPERSVKALSAFLVSNIDWLASHSAARDAVNEIHELTITANQALDPASSVRLALGPCQQSGCDGTAHVTTRGARPLDFQIRCAFSRERRRLHSGATESNRRSRGARCPALNSGQFPRSVSSDTAPLLTTELAAMVAGVPDATIRKWASRGKLTRYGHASQARYDLREILALVADRDDR
ncbi:helix-turn-helix domain-containing protein [Phytoactinopolyspora limicola]|uniref:helix-turn-helix domain-containing protein n=1 Tax=Phytoactinopolyspora limicola TaxID=2715536 RepID=UPI001A9C60E6|nr:helix-turn-helix domain-containing protein [Phytoactinopolyspora limicola]